MKKEESSASSSVKPKTDISLASVISKDVELKEILLRSANVRSEVHPTTDTARLRFSQEYSARYEKREDKRFEVLIALKLKSREKPLDSKVVQTSLIDQDSDESWPIVLELNAKYLIRYQLPEDKTYSEEAFEHFSKLNGTVHVWPYWRELVHTVAARVGLGSFTVPVFRVTPTVLKETPAATTTAVEVPE